MNKKLLWSILMVSIVSFTSCSDDEIVVETGQVPPHEGVTIGIGAAAHYEPNKNSRTIYPGIQVDNIEKINWILGDEGYHGNSWAADEITILSPNAVGPIVDGQQLNYAEYKAVSHSEKNPKMSDRVPFDDPDFNQLNGVVNPKAQDIGIFTPADRTPVGLKWNTKLADPTDHLFYAVYPSNHLNKSVKLTASGGKVTFEGTISSSQAAVGYIKDPSDQSGNTYIAMPVMRQNYMWDVHQATKEDVEANAIGLDFRTIGTVLEVELIWPDRLPNGKQEDVRVTSVMLSCNKSNVDLCGNFKVDLTNEQNGYPTSEVVPSDNKIQNIITVNLDANPDDEEVGIALPPNSKLKVRFIMLPVKGLKGEDLTLTVRGPNGHRSHVIAQQSSGFELAPHKLNMVKNVRFPNKLNTSNWISLLDDRILLSQLSIPGTGSSYLTDPEKGLNKYAQCLLVSDPNNELVTQWSMGIRCFDITVGDKGNLSDFGDIPLRVDNKSIIDDNLTVDQAFQTLLENVKLTNKDNSNWNGEFGMLIIRYQPAGTRTPDQFVRDFETYFNSGKVPQDRVCLYRPNLTVGEARGKIMVILCPSSEGEDKLQDVENAAKSTNYLLVNGCGSLPDKFYKRGYCYQDGNGTQRVLNKVAHTQFINESLLSQTAEHYIYSKQAAKLSIDPTAVNFTYTTNQKTFQAYMQDWIRVIDGNGSDIVTLGDAGYEWRASFQEKLENAKSTFSYAVQDKDHESAVYINSLCGFLVNEATYTLSGDYMKKDGKTPLGNPITINNKDLGIGQYQPIYNLWPAYAGNIKALADKMNPAFYSYMYNAILEGAVKGPMGVVLMNFVGDPNVAGSTLMPNMVISNNFSFPLKIGSAKLPEKPKENMPNSNAGGFTDDGNWLWK